MIRQAAKWRSCGVASMALGVIASVVFSIAWDFPATWPAVLIPLGFGLSVSMVIRFGIGMLAAPTGNPGRLLRGFGIVLLFLPFATLPWFLAVYAQGYGGFGPLRAMVEAGLTAVIFSASLAMNAPVGAVAAGLGAVMLVVWLVTRFFERNA